MASEVHPPIANKVQDSCVNEVSFHLVRLASYIRLRHVFIIIIIKYLTLSFVSLFVYLQVHKLVRQIPLKLIYELIMWLIASLL